MRRGKQKVRISTSVTEYGDDNGTVVKRAKRLSAEKGRQKRRSAAASDETDPLELPAKRGKAAKPVKTKAARKQPAQPKEYEVDKIVDHRPKGGEIFYRIRWKGWTAKDDTWETEEDLNCEDILKQYTKSILIAAASAPPASPKKRSAKKKKAGGVAAVAKKKGPRKTLNSKGSRGPPAKRGRKPKASQEWEVEEIVAARTTEKGEEEFYVKWKGYSSEENTWEPAANVDNCGKAIKRFRQIQDGVTPDEDDDEEEDEDDQPLANGDAAAQEDGEGTSTKSPVTTKPTEEDEDDE